VHERHCDPPFPLELPFVLGIPEALVILIFLDSSRFIATLRGPPHNVLINLQAERQLLSLSLSAPLCHFRDKQRSSLSGVNNSLSCLVRNLTGASVRLPDVAGCRNRIWCGQSVASHTSERPLCCASLSSYRFLRMGSLRATLA